MTLDMRVLQHLGIRLYSNVAAVISELVANSYDADATEVDIDFDAKGDKLIIRDNGSGMTSDAVNGRFLNVGYEKRKYEGHTSPIFKRPFMGRKGIGKLSVFSVAEIVQVHTSQSGDQSAFEIRLNDLEEKIKLGAEYFPSEISFDGQAPQPGTQLVLTNLVRKRTGITVAALRKRLARRFAVIGKKNIKGDYFSVRINGKEIDHNDRDDLRSLEYLWEFSEAHVIPSATTPKLAERFLLQENTIPNHPNWVVRGWFGTAGKPSELELDDAGSLKNIVVIARGRLIQESILDKLGFNRIFGSYVTGQIEADFLDSDDEDDIATSDRQRLVEDDPRVMALRDFMRQALLDASEKWSDLRKKKKADDAQESHPALKRWVDGLPQAQQAPAKSLIGLIEGLPLDDDREADRHELFKSGILAFERLRLKEAAHQLENLRTLDSDHLLPLLVTQDYYESSLYGDIVRSRVQAIRQFKNLTDARAKERVLQEHLFNNLWLLDAGWERATGSETMEHNLKRDFPKEFALDLKEKEKRGRIDIKYRTNAGTHIIVELKKYERTISHEELTAQGQMYKSCLFKLLQRQGDQNPSIQVVFVLGRAPKVLADAGLPADFVENSMKLWNGRIVYYDSLIDNALSGYGEYLNAHAKVDQIEKVVNEIGGGKFTDTPAEIEAAAIAPVRKKAPTRKSSKKKKRR
nr:ATP-binding protein [Lysobacter enzymogenes]